MRRGLVTCVAAAGLVVAFGTAWAQSSGGESPQANVRQSQQYEQLLCSNAAFRNKRIAQECGPLKDSEFYQSCVASFQCGAGARHRSSQKAPPSETIR
jgi:hypothetical protein